jgi:hypothetical protein
MLLRSMTKHVKEQNWFAVFLDFIIVVVGVFIGIQVSNWNTDAGNRMQEHGYIIRLHEDIEESIVNQTRDLNFLNMQLADQSIVLKSLDSCAVASEDSIPFQRAINMLGFINKPRFSRRTVDEMAASGQTGIIKNIKIQTELANIVALIGWRSGFIDNTSRVIESRRFVIEDFVRYVLNRNFPDAFIGEFAAVNFDIKAMCANPKVASSISVISLYTRERRNAYKPILKQYNKFLTLLDNELDNRWGYKIKTAITQ